MGANVFRCRGRAGLEYHERLHLLTLDRMRHADRGRVHHRMVREEGLLDFARIHVEARDDDHFLFAVDDGDVSLRVDRRDVAGVEPAVAECLRRLVRALVVTVHELRAAHDQLAGFARPHLALPHLEIDDL